MSAKVCPTVEELAVWLDQALRLDDAASTQVSVHLLDCNECAIAVAGMKFNRENEDILEV